MLNSPNNLLCCFPTKSASSFSPPDIAGCLLYLDPTLGVTKNGSNQVTGWADQSGNSNNASQSTASHSFVYTANALGANPGLLAATTNSSNMEIANPISGLTAFTLLFLMNPTAASLVAPFQYLMCDAAATAPPLVSLTPASNDVQIYDGTNSSADFIYTQTVGTSALLGFTSGARAAQTLLYLDNSALTPTSSSGNTVWSFGLETLGGDTVHGRYCDLYFGPIILYNSSLSSMQMTQLYNWYHTNGWI